MTIDREITRSPRHDIRLSRPAPADGESETAAVGEVVTVRIDSLLATESPRSGGLDLEHVQRLAAIDGQFPPIWVHYETMTVIDGLHRLLAAELNRADTIEARFFHGSPEDAFRLSVRANIAHGLPLPLIDRQAAALRIIDTHPMLSDRAVALDVGLAAQTVAKLRARAGADEQDRVGRDGRTRPLSTAEGRIIASQVITENPEASLREIARIAGISPGTARDVRQRIQAKRDPVPVGQRRSGPGSVAGRQDSGTMADAEQVDLRVVLEQLASDPSLRYKDSGRTLLRWLGSKVLTMQQWRDNTVGMPPHCATAVAALARELSRTWLKVADELTPPTGME